MGGPDIGAAALPSSHVFLTAAFGRFQKTIAVPRWAVVAIAAALVAGSLWSLGCTVYVVGHDSLLAAAMRRERDVQYGYEDHIAALQRQLERTLSQHAQLERSVGTRLDVLAAQEGELSRKADTLSGLAKAVEQLAPHGATRQATSSPEGAMPSFPDKSPGHDAQRDAMMASQATERLAALTQSLTDLDAAQQGRLARMQAVVADKASRFRTALTDAGLTLGRFGTKAGEGVGGPFVPLDADTVRSPFDRAALSLRTTLDAAAKLQAVVAHVPFGKPLDGAPEVTSPFGARLDPFLGRPALHTGIDLREESGTDVSATAPGRVVAAGPASGYGIMVEIDHGAGLTTRYAHLSAVTVEPGQSVGAGSIVGRVGATGRATGPHLHYETRIDGEPVDPLRFLQAGGRLAAASSAL